MSMNNEKAIEYQQVAALLSLDIDVLCEFLDSDITVEELKAQIILLKENRDSMIADPEVRKRRYNAAAMIFNNICEKS